MCVYVVVCIQDVCVCVLTLGPNNQDALNIKLFGVFFISIFFPDAHFCKISDFFM